MRDIVQQFPGNRRLEFRFFDGDGNRLRMLAGVTPEEMALEPYKAPPAPSAKDWPREKLLGFLRELADFVEKRTT